VFTAAIIAKAKTVLPFCLRARK